MTIASQTASITAQGDGSNTSFTYDFLIPYQADGTTPAVEVYTTDNLGTRVVLVLNTDYTITGVGSIYGGTVAYPISGDPLAASSTITISRALAYVQDTALDDQGFRASQVEGALDTLEMQIQQAVGLAQGAALAAIVTSLNGVTGAVTIQAVDSLQVDAFGVATSVATGDGKAWFMIPASYASVTLIEAAATLGSAFSSSGLPTIQLNNMSSGNDILSTPLTIDLNEQTSFTATTPYLINTAEATIAGGNLVRVDVDVAGTGTKGLSVAIVYTVDYGD